MRKQIHVATASTIGIRKQRHVAAGIGMRQQGYVLATGFGIRERDVTTAAAQDIPILMGHLQRAIRVEPAQSIIGVMVRSLEV